MFLELTMSMSGRQLFVLVHYRVFVFAGTVCSSSPVDCAGRSELAAASRGQPPPASATISNCPPKSSLTGKTRGTKCGVLCKYMLSIKNKSKTKFSLCKSSSLVLLQYFILYDTYFTSKSLSSCHLTNIKFLIRYLLIETYIYIYIYICVCVFVLI